MELTSDYINYATCSDSRAESCALINESPNRMPPGTQVSTNNRNRNGRPRPAKEANASPDTQVSTNNRNRNGRPRPAKEANASPGTQVSTNNRNRYGRPRPAKEANAGDATTRAQVAFAGSKPLPPSGKGGTPPKGISANSTPRGAVAGQGSNRKSVAVMPATAAPSSTRTIGPAERNDSGMIAAKKDLLANGLKDALCGSANVRAKGIQCPGSDTWGEVVDVRDDRRQGCSAVPLREGCKSTEPREDVKGSDRSHRDISISTTAPLVSWGSSRDLPGCPGGATRNAEGPDKHGLVAAKDARGVQCGTPRHLEQRRLFDWCPRETHENVGERLLKTGPSSAAITETLTLAAYFRRLAVSGPIGTRGTMEDMAKPFALLPGASPAEKQLYYMTLMDTSLSVPPSWRQLPENVLVKWCWDLLCKTHGQVTFPVESRWRPSENLHCEVQSERVLAALQLPDIRSVEKSYAEMQAEVRSLARRSFTGSRRQAWVDAYRSQQKSPAVPSRSIISYAAQRGQCAYQIQTSIHSSSEEMAQPVKYPDATRYRNYSEDIYC